MRLEHYEVKVSPQEFTFEFQSEGPKGRVRKVVQFTPLAGDSLFNLGFGDHSEKTDDFDDMSITNNGDTEKVLATVAFIVYVFSEQFPDAWIYASGSTQARNRLYRMGINRHFNTMSADFEILGRSQGTWELYRRGSNYDAFVVRQKRFRFEK